VEYSADIQLVLDSLSKDKRELLDKVNEIDKLIKKIKYGNLNLGLTKGNRIESSITDIEVIEQPKAFPLKADLKVQVIKIFEILGVASKLMDVQAKHKEITGLHHNLRETLRNLNKHEILKLIQPKGNQRGLYWVKAEWLEEDGKRLKEQHRFEGFDLLFSDDMIEFK
jgi:hypothetical protein